MRFALFCGRCCIIAFFASKHFPKILFFVLLSIVFFRNFGHFGCFGHCWMWRVYSSKISHVVVQTLTLNWPCTWWVLEEENKSKFIPASGKTTLLYWLLVVEKAKSKKFFRCIWGIAICLWMVDQNCSNTHDTCNI